MALENITEEIQRIEAELEELNRTTFEHSMKLREDMKQQTSTPAHQTVRKSDSGIMSEGPTEIRFKRREYNQMYDPEYPEDLDLTASPRFREKNRIEVRENEPRITVRRQRPLEAPTEKDEGGYKNPDTSFKKPSNYIKPATFDGSASWLDYKSHFEACAALNGWTDREKGLYLAVSLRGNAQGVLGNLAGELGRNYNELVRALEDRFAPANQTELYRVQLRERRQKATETLPELGQTIRRLAHLAYPTAPNDVRETLAKEQFIDALVDADMRLRIKQARPQSLNDAIRLAVELEAFIKSDFGRIEQKSHLRVANGDSSRNDDADNTDELTKCLKGLQSSLNELKSEIRELRKPDDSRRSAQNGSKQRHLPKTIKCYNCHEEGHISRQCPSKQKNRKRPVESNYGPKAPRPASVSAAKTRPEEEVKQPSVAFNRPSEAGMYAVVCIGGTEIKMLVDTGATVTLLSERAYNKVQQSNGTSAIDKVKQEIMTAEGRSLKVLGKIVANIQLGDREYLSQIVISDITVDGIIGLDFMTEHKCSLDIPNKVLSIGGEKHSLLLEGTLGCYRVVASESFVVPARSEIITTCDVCVPDGVNFRSGLGIVEPRDCLITTNRSLVGRTLVNNETRVPVRFMNLSQDPQTIYKGTNIGQLCPVEKVLETTKATDHQTNWSRELETLSEVTKYRLNQEQRKAVDKLLENYAFLFASSDNDLGRTNVVKHRIDTGDARPIKQPPRRLPVHMREEADKLVDDMLRRNVIEPSSSPWASGVVLVKKKDGSTRFCVDYRRLNSATLKDAYPLPRIDDMLDSLSGASWFSTLDLCMGYWQVEMEPEDKPKTAFATRKGLFQFRVMPFGLCNAGATFERLMETVLAGLNWEICLIYLDDIIVISKTFEEMVENLSKVFGRLAGAGLKLKAKKCSLFSRSVEYLGHVISDKGITTDSKKVEVIKTMKAPANVSELRSFLGICGYYRKFVKNFAGIAKPLHKLTEKNNTDSFT